MAKRERITNVDKLIKEGRGAGVGAEYKPWIIIQDVPSLGRVTRLKGIKTGRQHEFLSDLEKYYFYLSEYSEKISDIREQYPLLPLEETVMIAEELGLAHPKHPKTGEYIVMTTDFVITKKEGDNIVESARTIKYKEELLDKRVLEKFEIERVYWEKKDIDWGIVTECEVNKIMAQNISNIHSYYDIREIDSFKSIEKSNLEDLIFEYTRRILNTEESIRKISATFDEDMCLSKGAGIAIFKYILARKIIEVDLTNLLNIDENIDIKLKIKDLKVELNIS